MFNDINVLNTGVYTPMLQNTSLANVNRTHVMLFLFGKKYLPQQYRRPYILQFGGGFDRALNDKLAHLDTLGSNRYSDMFMRDSTDALNSIMPDVCATPINTKPFEEKWTFMLVVDHTASASPWASGSGSTPYRDIYTGYVLDEPMPVSFAGTRQPNPHAVFTTTHYTKLVCESAFMPSGVVNSVMVQADKDILPGENIQMAQMNSNETVYDLRPATLTNNIAVDPYSDGFNDTYSVHASPVTSGENNKPSIAVDTSLNSPVHYLANVVNGIASAATFAKSPMSQDRDVMSNGTDVLLASVSSQMRDGMLNVIDSFDPATPFLMGDLINKYSSVLDIQILNQPDHAMIDLCENGGSSARDVMTALITSALPSLLVQCQMMDIAFTYNSYQHDETEPPGVNGLMQIMSVAWLHNISEQQQAILLQRFKQFFRSDLANIITSSQGDFAASIKCSTLGSTLVNLHLFSYDTGNTGYVEQSNALGGINTPIAGGKNAVDHNASQLYHAVKSSIGTNCMDMGYGYGLNNFVQ